MAQRIQEVLIQNFKGIDQAKVDLNGKHVYLVAKNGAGKTSFIDAAFGNVKTSKPLKDGARKGLVSITIDDYICEFTFTEKNQKPKLNIFDRSGRVQKAPATLFEKLFGIQNFNIDDFLSQSSSKQVDFIKEIIGIDWTDIDNKYKSLYEERKFLNRKIKEQDAKISSIPFMKDTSVKDTDALIKFIDEAKDKNSEIQRISDGVKSREDEISELEEKLANLRKQVEDGNKWLNSNNPIDTEEKENELKEAIKHNQDVALFQQYEEDRKKGKEDIEAVDKIQEEMDKIQELKKQQLSECEMPVKGLTFDDDKLYLDGLPFESSQINMARRIIAGLEIQYALRGEVSIARLEGSLLDKDSMQEVIEWADEKGIQLFVEKVDFDGEELKIEVVES